MRIPGISLLILTTVALAASLAAQEINAPHSRWQDTPQSIPSVTHPATEQSQSPEARQQEKKQRILGIFPSFSVDYRSNAPSLTRTQKMGLALRNAVDPKTFAGALVVAGFHEAANDQKGFPWGAKGYGERAGAAYLDSFDRNIIGKGILPSLLRQDPRYFRLGRGGKAHRLLYAASSVIVCKHDNAGKWEPNYSNIGGNIAAGALSNLYYPDKDSGVGLTISNGMIVTAEGAFSAVFHEFWPDISRKLLHKDPTHGRDAEAEASGQTAEKK